MRLLVYARTSGSGDGEDSLDAQCDRCAIAALKLGHEIVGEHRDEGIRGALPVEDRPALLAAIMAIQDGGADGLIVHRLDRLARELHIQEAALAQAWAAGEHVTLFQATDGEILRDDPEDPHRTFLRQVLGAAAQLERGLIVARLQGGRKRKAARGEWIGGHRLHPRYGYIVDSGVYVQLAHEQLAITRMRELRDGGRGASYRAIAEALDVEGFAAPAGAAWHFSTVRKVLVREALPA